jgi:hypothetical protein
LSKRPFRNEDLTSTGAGAGAGEEAFDGFPFFTGELGAAVPSAFRLAIVEEGGLRIIVVVVYESDNARRRAEQRGYERRKLGRNFFFRTVRSNHIDPYTVRLANSCLCACYPDGGRDGARTTWGERAAVRLLPVAAFGGLFDQPAAGGRQERQSYPSLWGEAEVQYEPFSYVHA